MKTNILLTVMMLGLMGFSQFIQLRRMTTVFVGCTRILYFLYAISP